MNALSRYSGVVFCILRLIVGLMFACHGGQKLLGFPPGGHGAGEGIMLIGAWIELVCGFLVAFGFLTRFAAFVAAGEMAVAYFMMHAGGAPNPQAQFFPILNHGEPAVLYCWIFVFVLFHGPGAWSVDALVWKNKAAAMPAT
jgi:putative oxidoreductase